MKPFQLNFLDHVALRVKDINYSAQWYEKVLGLNRCALPEWKSYPVLMRCGQAGIALFPANTDDPPLDRHSRNARIDHFAFNLSREDFEKARAHFEVLELEYEFQDHYYFHSLYTRDPDEHIVELTTLVVAPELFYS